MRPKSIRGSAVTAILVAILTAAPALQAEEHENGETNDERMLKIFELEHCDPQDIVRLLAMRDGQMAPGSAGFRGQVRDPFGTGTRQVHAQDGRDLTIAVHPEERLLFVRGSEEEIEKVEKLVEAFDVEDGRIEKQQLNNMHLFPVDGDKASQVQSTLSQLQLPGQTLHIGNASFIVVRAEEDDQRLTQAEQVIRKLGPRDEEAVEDENEVDEQDDEEEDDEEDDDEEQGQEV